MNREFMMEVARAQMSDTVGKVAQFAHSGPFETKEDREAAFTTSFLTLSHAMDEGKIIIEDEEVRAMFYGLLTVTLVQILGKRPDLEEVQFNG